MVDGALRTALSEEAASGESTTATEELPEEVRTVLDGKSAEADLSLDEVFGLLRNRRRREVLGYLLRTEAGTATQGELAEYIAAKENDIQIQQLSSDQRKTVYISLYQSHLPKLNDAGVVDFERNRGTVELRESVSQLAPYLVDSDQVSDEREPTLELGITGVVAAGVAGGALGLGPLAAIPSLAWAGASTAAIVAITAHSLRSASPKDSEQSQSRTPLIPLHPSG